MTVGTPSQQRTTSPMGTFDGGYMDYMTPERRFRLGGQGRIAEAVVIYGSTAGAPNLFPVRKNQCRLVLVNATEIVNRLN